MPKCDCSELDFFLKKKTTKIFLNFSHKQKNMNPISKITDQAFKQSLWGGGIKNMVPFLGRINHLVKSHCCLTHKVGPSWTAWPGTVGPDVMAIGW